MSAPERLWAWRAPQGARWIVCGTEASRAWAKAMGFEVREYACLSVTGGQLSSQVGDLQDDLEAREAALGRALMTLRGFTGYGLRDPRWIALRNSIVDAPRAGGQDEPAQGPAPEDPPPAPRVAARPVDQGLERQAAIWRRWFMPAGTGEGARARRRRLDE